MTSSNRRANPVVDLPSPVARYRDLARVEGPRRVETVVLDMVGSMREQGWPRIPLEITMYHRLGHEFVHDIRVGRRPIAVRLGLDAYVGGHGVVRIGPSLKTGSDVDRGTLVVLWTEALGFPSSWERRDDVHWEPVDANASRLVVLTPGGDLAISVTFDLVTGCPLYYEADRHKEPGRKVGWRASATDWRRFDTGVLAPGRFDAQWADEPRPWIELRTRAVHVNAPVEEGLALARATANRAYARLAAVDHRGRRPVRRSGERS
jgi:hypothetical protein